MLKKLGNASLIKKASIYTVANILNALIPFLLMPILTRYLSPADYGITAMQQVMIVVITPFIGLSLDGAIGIKYYKKEKIDFPKYISSCLLILSITSMLMILVFIGFSKQISEYTSFPINWLWSVLLICCGQFLISIILSILQSTGQAKLYGGIQIVQTIMNLTLSIWLIVVLNFNWQGRIIAQVCTNILFIGISVYLLNKWDLLVFSCKAKYIKDALKFGVPLIPHALSAVFIATSDRFWITDLIGVDATGVYSAGAQIGLAISLFACSFNCAYAPWLYAQLSSITVEKKQKIVKLTYAYFVFILIFASAFSIVMPIFLKFFLGEKFTGSGDYIFGIALGGAFQGMYFMVVNYIFYLGKTYQLTSITFFVSIMHIVSTYWIVSYFGAVGATYSTAFTSCLTFVLVWILSNKVYPMPWYESIKIILRYKAQ